MAPGANSANRRSHYTDVLNITFGQRYRKLCGFTHAYHDIVNLYLLESGFRHDNGVFTYRYCIEVELTVLICCQCPCITL